jgi:hypothetical protein
MLQSTDRFVIELRKPLQNFADNRSPRCDILRLAVHAKLNEVLQHTKAESVIQ